MSEMSAPLSPVKQALVEIRRLRQRLADAEAASREPIAIIGMGVRFPGGAHDPEHFHEQLCGALDAITEVPRERWDTDRYFDENRDVPGTMYTRHGGFLDDVAGFDPEFFGISPFEASTMDPQHRLLLEVTWEMLEHAGVAASSLRGSRTGVFVGIAAGDYGRLALRDAAAIDEYASLGTAFSVAAGRLSYVLGVHGPAVSVDTACSSSLVAVHLACQSLRLGESELAIAAGVNLILSPEITINFCRAGMLAPDGRCKTFDASADGYVRSEGCGAVLLKRLSDAQRDGDRILAVVRGSAVNQDGRSSGLTAPNGPAQEAVMRAALANAGLRAADIDYVEAHGTGTSLGDPIEVQALGAVFGSGRAPDRPLLVGSVKTNLGHLEAAAGVAGLIKAVQALRHREIPPHLHFSRPNPHVAWESLPIAIPVKRTPFEPGTGKRRAGVSSFGFSGTNAHIILEEPPAQPDRAVASDVRAPCVLAISAPQEQALRTLASQYAEYLGNTRDDFADICHTAAVGRTHFRHRIAVVATDVIKAQRALIAWLAGAHGDAVHAAHAPSAQPAVAFVFGPAADDEQVRAQLAIADQWRRLGFEPAVVTGRDTGECVAACVAGAFDVETALQIAALREAAWKNPAARSGIVAQIEGILQATAAVGGGPRFVSARTGAVMQPAELRNASYWAHVGGASQRFDAAMQRMRGEEVRWFIEIGASDDASEASLASHQDGIHIRASSLAIDAQFAHALAELYAAGADVRWKELDRGNVRRRVDLPTYAFQRRPFWLQQPRQASAVAAPSKVAEPPRESAPDVGPAVLAAAMRRSQLAPLDLNVGSYATKWAALEELTREIGRNVIADAGVFAEAGATADAEGVLAACSAAGMYRPIFDRWLDALAADGTLERVPDGFRAVRPVTSVNTTELWETVSTLLYDNRPLFNYLKNSATLLPDVMCGKASALETLFPGGSFELATSLYEQSTVMRYVNGIAAAAVEAFVARSPADAPIRVLEVGAGTGGTTSSILPVLPADRTRYDFTDVSEIFLENAAERFAKFPFVRTRQFDVEKDADQQDLAGGSYDIIVGSNVLHAARNIRSALANIQSLLAPGGILLLIESTGHLAWHDISTGLIEGWQHFEDDLRRDTPLLPAARWLEVLEDAGFEHVGAAPEAESIAGILKQHVLVACAPRQGSVRRAVVDADSPAARDTVAAVAPTHANGEFAKALSALGGPAREEHAVTAVRECVMEILRSDPGRPPARDARLMELGVDSLMAVRLRNLIQKKLGLEKKLPATLIFDYPTITHIARLVIERTVGDAQPAKAAVAADDTSDATRAAEIAALSEAEAEALLLSRLEMES